MSRFNLTFSGEIHDGKAADQVKEGFGKLFAIDDPQRLERFFSGQAVTLRRNLGRKEAAEVYRTLNDLGLVAELVKIPESEEAAAVTDNRHNTNQSPPTADSLAADHARAARQIRPLSSRPTGLKQASSPEKRQHDGKQAALDAERQRLLEEKAARRAAEEAEKQRQRARKAARREAKRLESLQRDAEQRSRREAELANKRRLREEATARKVENAARKRAEREQRAARQREQARQAREKAAAQRREAAEQRRRSKLAAARQRKAPEALQREAEAEIGHRREPARQGQATRQATQRQTAAVLKQKKTSVSTTQAPHAESQPSSLPAANSPLEAKPSERSIHAELDTLSIQRAAAELGSVGERRLSTPRLRSRFSLPQRESSTKALARRKRQPGEPNVYSLQPFRNTQEVRGRAQRAQHRRRHYLGLAALALIGLIGTSLLYPQLPQQPAYPGATAGAGSPGGGPVLLMGETLLLHDRAGVATEELRLDTLGLSTLRPPIAFDQSGHLYGLGRLHSDAAAQMSPLDIVRCDLDQRNCEVAVFAEPGRRYTSFVFHPLSGGLFVTESQQSELLQFDSGGILLQRATLELPDDPRLQLDSGLLFMNSPHGPAVSVFRYDRADFGTQVDEVLLLPPRAVEREQTLVADFVLTDQSWWVSMLNPDTGGADVYRFDPQWQYLSQLELPIAAAPLSLIRWGSKVLVNDHRTAELQRFNPLGAVEVPWTPTALTDQVANEQQLISYSALGWRLAMLLCGLTLLVGIIGAYLQGLRKLVYRSARERGAEPVDGYVEQLRWIDRVPERTNRLKRRTISYGLVAAALCLVAVGYGVAVTQLTALLLLLSGPAIALFLMSRRPAGNIGVLPEQLLLVDHQGTYHLGGGSQLQYRGHFLLLDDVVVYTGNRLLPGFVSEQVQQLVAPLATRGVRVDRTTVWVKLLQSKHPLAQGAVAVLAGTVVAAGTLLLPLINA
ncbi:MAG: hypothetical protein AAGA91_11475 [Pseudomonadota bacterium]